MAWPVGDMPGVGQGSGYSFKEIFYSQPEDAAKIPATLQAGFGVLDAGTALAVNGSAAGGKGRYIPYDPTAITGNEIAPGRAYVLQDVTAVKTIFIGLQDSYKFSVGDEVHLIDADTSALDLGAITAIDRTTYNYQAVVTVTNTANTNFTVAQHAYLAIKGSDTCVGVLIETKDAGYGEGSVGAISGLIIGSVILYSAALVNVDAAAISDLGARAYGKFLYLP